MQPADEVAVEIYDGPAAALTDDLRVLYATVYAEPPYRDGPADVAEFVAEWPELLDFRRCGSTSSHPLSLPAEARHRRPRRDATVPQRVHKPRVGLSSHIGGSKPRGNIPLDAENGLLE